jgi:hypothetical protein
MDLSTYRVIPCDIGGLLDGAAQAAIRQAINRLEGWRSENCFGHTGSFAYAERTFPGCNVTLSVFDDGIVIFEIVEDAKHYDDFGDFDPAVVTDQKRAAHSRLLRQEHGCSGSITQVMETLRIAAGLRNPRQTSLVRWEHGGLSYVFSYYIISLTSHEATKKIDDHITRLLYPLHSQSLSDKAQVATIDLTWSINRPLGGHDAQMKSVEVRPGLNVLSSWSTMCVIGIVSDDDPGYFRRLQVSIQHCWFFCYIMAYHVERQFEALRSFSNPYKVAAIDQEIADLRMKLADIRYIRSSTAKLAEFILFENLLASSRIDILIHRIDDVSAVFQERYANALRERRLRHQRVLEVFLFIFALLTAVEAGFSIMAHFAEQSSSVRSGVLAKPIPMAPQHPVTQPKR